MPRRLEPDDEIRRYNAVWLGPDNMTFFWAARYLAYGVGAVVFLVIAFIYGITPLEMGTPPIWPAVLTVLITTAVMFAVDHDRPVLSALQTTRNATRTYLTDARERAQAQRAHLRQGFIKTTKDPLHGEAPSSN